MAAFARFADLTLDLHVLREPFLESENNLLQASEARQLASHALGGSPGPRGYPVCLSSEDEEQHHLLTDGEAEDARAA